MLDRKSVMDRMGQARITTTQKYLHTLPNADAKNLDELRIVTEWPSGGQHRLNLVLDDDLRLKVADGKNGGGSPRYIQSTEALVVVHLEVDEDPDEVRVGLHADFDTEEALGRTVETAERALAIIRKMRRVCRLDGE